ncbi:DUF2784 domain-containing protein [Parabacteroides sp. FAFU027]|uniref:DUF2784 domain-containing protein n=1 Tax=Parabacteroides sp. FAFU027 TaxID=2922715 RepID=UPI001FAED481|nr:DUF2784 domain-containing protein [Parabacteroides sp. FAFU027]
MLYRLLADFIVLIHFSFILFVVLGGLLVLRWRKVIYFHIPAMFWGAIVEFYNIICPLTPWENHFREVGGAERYESDFIENYLIPVMYPAGLTVSIQFILGCLVVVTNLIIYSIVIWKYRKNRKHEAGHSGNNRQSEN